MTIYTQGHYSLRRFLPADWAVYKTIRLEALENDPSVFGTDYDEEFQYTPDEWRRALNNPDRAYFGLFDDNTVIGMTGIMHSKTNAEEAILIASYINPGYRGKKLSVLMYISRIDWAKAKGFKRVVASHRISNEASKAANQKHGFIYTHAKRTLWPDGVEADQLYYVLDL